MSLRLEPYAAKQHERWSRRPSGTSPLRRSPILGPLPGPQQPAKAGILDLGMTQESNVGDTALEAAALAMSADVIPAPPDPTYFTELWVFRVEEGLGNACALIFPDGSGAVIDWGTQRAEPLDKLIALLQRAPTPRLRFVVATHPHADHTLGLEGLLEAMADRGIMVDRLIFPTPVSGSRRTHLGRARLRARDLRIKMSAIAVSTLPDSAPAPAIALGVRAGHPDHGWIVRVIAPIDTGIGAAEARAERSGTTPGNETSLILQFTFLRRREALRRGRALLPGDATVATLRLARRRSEEIPELSLMNDALVVPHHGSRRNWIAELTDTLLGFALVSAPSGRMHHPSADVLRQAVSACGSGPGSRLVCTSFAGVCHAAWRKDSKGVGDLPGRLDPCFGDIGVRLAPDAPPWLIAYDPLGPDRRRFGHCRSR